MRVCVASLRPINSSRLTNDTRTLGSRPPLRWRAPPEPQCPPTEEQGKDWKSDGTDTRTTPTRAKSREEGRHHEQAKSIEGPEGTDEGRDTGENPTHTSSPRSRVLIY